MNVEYRGKFLPEQTDAIKGKYGLVWDGDSISSCTGDFGKYLHFNSSHKISLYIRANLPLIMWNQSSLADFVLTNKIGIVVSSLENLGDEINKVQDREYMVFVKNIKRLSEKLSNGEMFLTSLKKIDEVLL